MKQPAKSSALRREEVCEYFCLTDCRQKLRSATALSWSSSYTCCCVNRNRSKGLGERKSRWWDEMSAWAGRGLVFMLLYALSPSASPQLRVIVLIKKKKNTINKLPMRSPRWVLIIAWKWRDVVWIQNAAAAGSLGCGVFSLMINGLQMQLSIRYDPVFTY